MTETTDEQIIQRRWLEVFEERAHNALLKAESGWREFTEEMREIKRTEAYKEAGYRYFGPYYRERWEERTGKTFATVKTYFIGLDALEEFESAMAGDHVHQRMPGVQESRILRTALPDPADRVGAWQNHLDSGRPHTADRSELRESIREYKGEPTVRDVLKPADMADVPRGEFDRFENWASETSKLVGPISRMAPDEVADACERLYPEKIERHIAWADEIAQWYGAYRDELVARQRSGIRAVK